MARRSRAEAESAAAEANRAAAAVPEPAAQPSAQPPGAEYMAPTPGKNPRNEAMEELVALRNPPPTAEPEPAPALALAPTPEPQPEPAAVAPEPGPEPAPAADPVPEPVKTSRQVVDGKEYEVPLAEIEESGGERVWRLNKAAQNRLDEAKEALAESKRNAAAVAQQQNALAQWVQQNTQPQQTPDQQLQQAIEVIRGGTPEQSAQALRAVIRAHMPQVNPAEIENRMMFKVNQQAGAAKFRDEFSDLAANPLLMEFAGNLENKLLGPALQAAGITSWADPNVQHFDFPKFYRNIGNQVRGAFQRPSQPLAAPKPQGAAGEPQAPTSGNPSPAQSEREARKASIVNLPTASSARAEAPAEDKPETREETLNRMRKARGLPTH